ncbi:ZMAT4 protein, partial [Copsychus sechellarum]|nr:ZMAT4 protein [Copsychus sechellarum]
MKSSDADQELFTESYCKVCSAQLISESQRVAHYESRKHASKVRLYYMLHPVDGGCPAKKLRSENGSDGDSVDKNKCCTLCNMSFTSAVVAESHYQGKIHAKRLKLLLGEQPALKATGQNLGGPKPQIPGSALTACACSEHRGATAWLGLCPCPACTGRRNGKVPLSRHISAALVHPGVPHDPALHSLSRQVGSAVKGLKRSYTCNICNVTLNSIEQYHAHLKGSKHQAK